ncbi:MAG: SDR family oxidoreductase [Alphaproteobacteria bacterium]|nr:SDR family oxidoreductase [Alphaproteobacteria bacterium]MBT7944315.1 SDR family oxidoreductase [Alphaproteobacteria bacterium]
MAKNTPLKSVLVTGAARRIGRAIALDLAKAGWTVAVHCNRSRDEAGSVVDEISAMGGKAAVVEADLAVQDAAEGLVAQANDAIGPLSCLVNNASVFEKDTPETATRESWESHMQVNLHAPFQLIQGFIKQRPADVDGNIINLIDQRVWNVTPFFTSYTVSKVALWGLTQNLALALAPSVRVNAIGPGPTLPSIHQTTEQFERQWSAQPLSRPALPEEICRAIQFVLDAPSMTGQMIVLDGGQHLGWAPGSTDEEMAD